MAIRKSAPTIVGTPPPEPGKKPRWFVGLVMILGFLGVGWLGLWAREEMATRSTARSARDRIAAGQFDAAGPFLDRFLKARPKSAEAHFLAAQRCAGLDRFDMALTELRLAQNLGYPVRPIDRQRGIVLAKLGLLNEAEPILRRVYLAHASDNGPDAEVDEALARCYLETFQLRAADLVIKRWLIDDPASAKACFWKAEVERHKADPDQDVLISLYERVLSLDHNHDKARLALAELYLKVHRSNNAASEYEAYLKRHPDDVEACLGLGQIAAEEGRDGDAIRLLDHAARLASKDYRPLVERGKMEIRRGQLAAALGYFDKAVQLDLTEPEIHYQRSLILTQLGRHDEANRERSETARLRKGKEELARLLKDLNKAPADVKLQLKAARWLFDRGHPEEGKRWAEKVVRDEPKNAEANRLLADHYLKQGNPGLANYYRSQAGAP